MEERNKRICQDIRVIKPMYRNKDLALLSEEYFENCGIRKTSRIKRGLQSTIDCLTH